MKIKSIFTIIYTTIVIVIVFSLTVTMSQEQFITQSATLKFLFWQTSQYPIILFVAAAFVIGLLTGLIIAVIDNFHSSGRIRELKKQVIELEKKNTKLLSKYGKNL